MILSPGPYMGLTFRSDFSNEERFTGFDAHYTAVGKQHLSLQGQPVEQGSKFVMITVQVSLGFPGKRRIRVQPLGHVGLTGCSCVPPHRITDFSVLWKTSPQKVMCGELQGDLSSLLTPF